VRVLDNLSSGSPANLAAADVAQSDFEFHEGDVRDYGVVEAATRDVDRFVFASSCNCYGRAEARNIDETVEPDPINPYAETKHEAEQLFAEYGAAHDVDTTALWMSTVYGDAPGVRFNLVVNAFVFRALTDRPLTVCGDGSNWRPFVHVEDAARAFADAAIRPERWPAAVYNVGANAENYRIETIAETGFDLQWSLPECVTDLAARLGGARAETGTVQSVLAGGETDD
jgi:nucleoside-diphosphate-sugar epimerase